MESIKNMSTVCPHCNNSFANRGNLNRHIKTAQYCLELRASRRALQQAEVESFVQRVNSVPVRVRRADKFMHRTQLERALKAFDAFNAWKATDATQTLLRAMERVATSKIIDGVWVHPDVAIAFAQSISVEAWMSVTKAQREM